ncbi:MAG: hypothetical protein ACLUEQ_04210 [Cloacibacillus evryensis]
MILAFMAAGVMLGTAWAANENPYPNGGTIDLTKINNEDVYRPEANGVNTVNISGDLGTKDALDAKNFKIYGAKDVAGDSSLVLDWQAKLYTQGKVQFFAGGDGSDVKGNSSLTVNAADGRSCMRMEALQAPSNQ